MTAQKSLRRKISSLLATGTAALVALSGLALAPAVAHAAEGPTLTVSKSALNPEGDTFTVTGTGFDASAKGLPSYYGCADPTNGTKGVYVQVGWIKDTWRPSTGGVNNTDRKGISTQGWFADDTNCVAPDRWTIAEDGTASFSKDFTITKSDLGTPPEGARYAVYTSGGGGGTQAVNELSVNLMFPEFAANVTNATTAGLDVSFAISGIDPSIAGAYGAIFDKAAMSSATGMGADYVAFKMPPFVQLVNGAAEFSLTAPKAKLDRTKEYVAVIWKQHSDPVTENIYAISDIAVTDAQWNTVFAAEPKPVPFTDIAGTTHESGIKWMFQEGYVAPADKFNPTNATTRGAMLTMLARINEPNWANWKPSAATVKNLPFKDVKPSDAHYKSIAWGFEKGYVAKADKFNTSSVVTRGAMGTFLQRINEPNYKPQSSATLSGFTDVKSSDTHYKGIAWLAQHGYAAPADKFNASNSTTRGAMATFLKRIYS